jgi:hypothetical protein
MPPLEEDDLCDFAALWEATGFGADGQPTVSSTHAVIPVRWVTSRRQSISLQGQPIAVDAQVATNVQVPVGSRLYLIPEGGLLGTGTFESDDDALYEVVSFKDARDVKGIFVRRELSCARSTDSLP